MTLRLIHKQKFLESNIPNDYFSLIGLFYSYNIIGCRNSLTTTWVENCDKLFYGTSLKEIKSIDYFLTRIHKLLGLREQIIYRVNNTNTTYCIKSPLIQSKMGVNLLSLLVRAGRRYKKNQDINDYIDSLDASDVFRIGYEMYHLMAPMKARLKKFISNPINVSKLHNMRYVDGHSGFIERKSDKFVVGDVSE